MAATTESKKMITVRSSDGEEFEIEVNVAMESQTIKPMIEDDCAESVIPLPKANSKVLSKVIEYSKKHVDSSSSMSDEKTADEELKAWDAGTLFDLFLSSKSRKRKRGSKDSGSKSSGGLSGKRSRKESIKSKDTPKTKEKSADDEEEDDEIGVPAEDDEPENSESKEKEFESEKEAEDAKENDPEEKSSGKKVDKSEGKSKESGESGPSIEDLRWFIIHYMGMVDIYNATFASMFNFFCRYFGIDLTPRKADIKQIVEEEVAVHDNLFVKIQYDGFVSDDE